LKKNSIGNGKKMFVKGENEGVIDRCKNESVGNKKVKLNEKMKNRIIEIKRKYGNGSEKIR
jgi:uncharacterized protein YlzI (FlbEa/FlbD family)